MNDVKGVWAHYGMMLNDFEGCLMKLDDFVQSLIGIKYSYNKVVFNNVGMSNLLTDALPCTKSRDKF